MTIKSFLILSVVLTTGQSVFSQKTNFLHESVTYHPFSKSGHVAVASRFYSKSLQNNNDVIRFVDTETGTYTTVTIPEGYTLHQIEEVKAGDTAGHHVLIIIKGHDQEDKKMLAANIRTRIFVTDIQGAAVKELTPELYHTSSWHVNPVSGRVILSGFYDRNGNKRADKGDENRLLLYDLESKIILKEI